MEEKLFIAFQSSLLGWLTIAFLFIASIDTYIKRIDQAKKGGYLPSDTQSASVWFGLIFWIEAILKVFIIVLNWPYGLALYILGFVLAFVGILENIGRILMYPFLRVTLPSYDLPLYNMNEIANRLILVQENTSFISKTVLTVLTYLGVALLLNTVRKDADITFLQALMVLQLISYIYIFYLAEARMIHRGYRAFWFIVILFFLGGVNDFELFVIPFVTLVSFFLPHRKLVVVSDDMLEQTEMFQDTKDVEEEQKRHSDSDMQ
ncbi:MAG: hypothetical protein ACYC0V_02055 [Armatimonadota bacterium]